MTNEAHTLTHCNRFCLLAHLFPDHTLLFIQRSFTTRPRMVLPWQLNQKEQNLKNKGKKEEGARKSVFFCIGHDNNQNYSQTQVCRLCRTREFSWLEILRNPEMLWLVIKVKCKTSYQTYCFFEICDLKFHSVL